jgi:3'-phosphoadenosine 5'-phosphosulfate sulfotransferase (PAPS reductase)/FAD synthetase
MLPPLATTPEIDALLAAEAPVCIGVSGGKDSNAVAFATIRYLDRIGHKGPRLLIHADLGATEWQDSLPTCRRLAAALGLELVVVKRPQGDMMDRWEQRWRDNVRRWETLSCVKLILPWSTPAMRFCTAELKVDQICRELSRRFPGTTIVNVTGIRRQESTERAKAKVSKPQPKLASKTRKTQGVDWLPIVDWTIDDVWACHKAENFKPHEAYTIYQSSRVSCVWCILATEKDHKAGMADLRNHDLGRRMVDLEIRSTFAFQGSRWLGDTLASILDDGRRLGIAKAKIAADVRVKAEANIPKHLLYTKNWPTCVPTKAEAKVLAEVRVSVAFVAGLKPTFTGPDEIRTRYRELMDKKAGAA